MWMDLLGDGRPPRDGRMVSALPGDYAQAARSVSDDAIPPFARGLTSRRDAYASEARSTGMHVPLIADARSLERNAITSATSRGSIILPAGL